VARSKDRDKDEKKDDEEWPKPQYEYPDARGCPRGGDHSWYNLTPAKVRCGRCGTEIDV
jgi:nitrate reductase alpha subunit